MSQKKTNVLPKTEIPRIAPFPLDQKISALHAIRGGAGGRGYDIFRRIIPDIMNLQDGLFTQETRTPIHNINNQIKASAKDHDHFRINLAVTRALYKYCEDKKVYTWKSEDPFPDLPLPDGRAAAYWTRFFTNMDGQKYILSIDPGADPRYSRRTQKFISSLIHHVVREAVPEAYDAKIGILQIRKTSNNSIERKCNLINFDESGLYSSKELEDMINSTFRLWTDLCENRLVEMRRHSRKGPLL